MLSPLFKSGNVSDNAIKHMKLPKGMSEVEARYLMTRYKFTEGILKENPEYISVGDYTISYKNSEARAFGLCKKKMYVGDDNSVYHYTLGSEKGCNDRKDLQYPGRLWLKSKIISFWKFPPPKQFKKFMKMLGKDPEINQNLLDGK